MTTCTRGRYSEGTTKTTSDTVTLGGHVRTWICFGKAGSLLKFCGWVPNIEKQSLFGVETYDELPTPTLKYTALSEKHKFFLP